MAPNATEIELRHEIRRLQKECNRLAGLLMSEYVFVHETLVEEVDFILKPYMGSTDD